MQQHSRRDGHNMDSFRHGREALSKHYLFVDVHIATVYKAVKVSEQKVNLYRASQACLHDHASCESYEVEAFGRLFRNC